MTTVVCEDAFLMRVDPLRWPVLKRCVSPEQQQKKPCPRSLIEPTRHSPGNTQPVNGTLRSLALTFFGGDYEFQTGISRVR